MLGAVGLPIPVLWFNVLSEERSSCDKQSCSRTRESNPRWTEHKSLKYGILNLLATGSLRKIPFVITLKIKCSGYKPTYTAAKHFEDNSTSKYCGVLTRYLYMFQNLNLRRNSVSKFLRVYDGLGVNRMIGKLAQDTSRPIDSFRINDTRNWWLARRHENMLWRGSEKISLHSHPHLHDFMTKPS